MSEDLSHLTTIAHHAALSLVADQDSSVVNGLYYNRVTADITVPDLYSGEMDRGSFAPRVVVYYPADTIGSEPFLTGINLSEGLRIGNGVLKEFLKGGNSQNIVERFSRYAGTKSVVEFVRQAYIDNVPLRERRNQILRDFQAPLAAIAIYATDFGFEATLSTVYFAWPWAAFAEMQHHLNAQE